MEYFVADSYKDYEIVNEAFTAGGKMYYNIRRKCPKCGGKGIISCYGYIDNGICFDCSGSGIEERTVRAYTAKEKETLQKKAEIKSEQKKTDNVKKFKDNNGFNAEDKTYAYVGNTYACKDILKAAGARYNPLLGWHSASELSVPADCFIIVIPFSEVYEVNQFGVVIERASAKEFIKNLSSTVLPAEETPDPGEYMGSVGERLRNISTKISSVREIESAYGLMQIITFKDNDNHTFVWMTSSLQDVEAGQEYLLSGTVKELKEFRGIKQTLLSRCRLG